MDGSLAIAVLIIAGFTAFVLWARTAGRRTLEQAFGPPHGMRRPSRARKRPATTRKASGRRTTGRK